ncbi:segregation and condensation protein A [Lapidilactobacillus mulanensis]|uniref:Segregation and condensation protein A n=1 Tax=Lapidilactobacillus mulanensis TaxID=2485999 RepID=A0ABW4DSW3_9LACO|nr:segregation/condensation protein A [Lapidilactobacillus mulanensis]
MATQELQLQLTKFEGPLDLLLQLIKKQEIDIYDIPIAQITDQYLAYLNSMEKLELDIAGEYLVMAATLMAIKSRFLLPQSKVAQLDAGDAEPIDPRQALVDQLLAYQTYQEVSHFLARQSQQRARYFTKEVSAIPQQPIQPLPKGLVTTTELGAALSGLLAKQAQDVAFVNQTIDREVFSIEAAQELICTQIKAVAGHRLRFSQLIQGQTTRQQVISLFLACLELMKNKVITCYQDGLNEEIRLNWEGMKA